MPLAWFNRSWSTCAGESRQRKEATSAKARARRTALLSSSCSWCSAQRKPPDDFSCRGETEGTGDKRRRPKAARAVEREAFCRPAPVPWRRCRPTRGIRAFPANTRMARRIFSKQVARKNPKSRRSFLRTCRSISSRSVSARSATRTAVPSRLPPAPPKVSTGRPRCRQPAMSRHLLVSLSMASTTKS